MWIVHYGLLGAMTAATINILSFARSVVFLLHDRKWAKSRAWLWAFLVLYVVNTILTWDGPRSLLPGIAMSMTTIALWTRDMRRTRLLYLTNSPFWFTYDILARSYSCMVIEAIAFVSRGGRLPLVQSNPYVGQGLLDWCVPRPSRPSHATRPSRNPQPASTGRYRLP